MKHDTLWIPVTFKVTTVTRPGGVDRGVGCDDVIKWNQAELIMMASVTWRLSVSLFSNHRQFP
jgi:hypothetical protein